MNLFLRKFIQSFRDQLINWKVERYESTDEQYTKITELFKDVITKKIKR